MQFFNLIMFYSSSCGCCKILLQQCHVMNEHAMKQAYNEMIFWIDHDTLTPLVFPINSNVGREWQKLYSFLTQLISENSDLPQLISSYWIRTKFYFGLLKSSMLCLRGSRARCWKTLEYDIDVYVLHAISKI